MMVVSHLLSCCCCCCCLPAWTPAPCLLHGRSGITVTFTYTMTNTGNETLTQVQLKPGAGGPVTVTVDKCTPTPDDNLVLASLAVGQSMVCTVEYTTKQADLNADRTLNATADAAGKGPRGVRDVPATAQGSATVGADLDPNWKVELTTPTDASTQYKEVGEFWSLVCSQTGSKPGWVCHAWAHCGNTSLNHQLAAWSCCLSLSKAACVCLTSCCCSLIISSNPLSVLQMLSSSAR